jgi:hypothetical protein
MVQTRISHGQIQAVFLVEPEEDALLAHMDVRYRLRVRYNATEPRTMAHVRWLHGRWLAEEACRYELPVVEPRRLPDARPTDRGGLELKGFSNASAKKGLPSQSPGMERSQPNLHSRRRKYIRWGADSPGDGPGDSHPSRQFLTLPFKIL